jgi:endonuclease/exonuclease/phosphatase family metal-dependent hydrolase
MKKIASSFVLLLAILGTYCLFCSTSLVVNERGQVRAKRQQKSNIVLCTWNVAHYYAYGSSKKIIDGPIYESKLKEFREIVYDSINADLISLNEYSTVFGIYNDSVRHLASEVLFDGYNTWIEGGLTKHRVGHNAIYSNVRMGNFQKHEFEYNKTTNHKNSYDYYYLSSDLYIDRVPVKFIGVYLVSSRKDPSLVQNQIVELIEKFKDEKRVVMCGDFNTKNYSKFKKAGYKLANDGSIVTFYKKSAPLDNIVTKGVKISDVRVVKTELSDHYPLVCSLSID